MVKLAQELQQMGHQVSQRSVYRLGELGYSLQSHRKTTEGKQHEDRDVQFQHINETVEQFQQRQQPVISVDAKKKELIGAQKRRSGMATEGEPVPVKQHDFMDKELKDSPWSVRQNKGWVSVGVDHETASLAVETTAWYQMGNPIIRRQWILITADCGGSNSYRSRLWKWELQQQPELD